MDKSYYIFTLNWIYWIIFHLFSRIHSLELCKAFQSGTYLLRSLYSTSFTATQGNATQGNATQVNATQFNATQGNATQGNATQDNATQGNSWFEV